MPFEIETTDHGKSILLEFQGLWSSLRHAVTELVSSGISPNITCRLLFHIDDAMSWKSVRDFRKMQHAFLAIKHIVHDALLPADIQYWIDEIQMVFDKICETLHADRVG